jgi:antitoxin HicB
MTKKNPHIGSSFEDFVAEEGLLEDCTNTAMKRVVAWQVEQAMKERSDGRSQRPAAVPAGTDGLI